MDSDNKKEITVWLAGDSTVSSFNDNYFYPRYGYGTKLGEYLEMHIENLALSGRSTRSYLKEPEYKTLISGIKDGDFLMLGFGHNDQKNDPERYTNANFNYKTPGSFKNHIYDNYILKAQKKGAKVILCTPIVRRPEDGVWLNHHLHIKDNSPDFPEFPGGNYRQAILDLGLDLKIPVIDLTGLSKKLHDSLGHAETLYLMAWLDKNPESVDNTHTNIYGAHHMAHLIAKDIYDRDIYGLSGYTKKIDNPPLKSKILKPN
ncbi:MAG: GDSL-type esterase/lipase family protein [Eubacterium sp.]|nr:GDSL-type esterase/lipase family protein [Eubacterium sp.]